MRKFLLLLACTGIFNTGEVSSQCTPLQNLPSTGIFPSLRLFQYLPNAYVDSNYSTIVYFWFDSLYRVGTDTCPDGKFVIDSATIQNIFGLPAGFSYQPDKPGKTYKGGAKGCMNIKGLPDEKMIGVYPLGASIIYHLFCVPALLPLSILKTDSIVQYLTVRRYTGISETENYGGKLFISPMPVVDNLKINIGNDYSSDSYIQIQNYLGQIIYEGKIILNPGNNLITLPVSGFKRGVYTVLIIGKGRNYRGKIIKQ